MVEQDIPTKCNQIINWFVKNHNEWVDENRLVSWAEKLGIRLNCSDTLDENSLFHLLVLGVLWNSCPTYRVEKGEDIFRKIKGIYTLTKFKEAYSDRETRKILIQKAKKEIKNEAVFNILDFTVNGNVNNTQVWTKINDILNSKNIGDGTSDVNRLRRLYYIFNSINEERYYEGQAYLTKKVFLIFREIRIQFRKSGKFQYHPSICCVPDSHIEKAVTNALPILDKSDESEMDKIEWLLKISDNVAKYFCTSSYELYDLPLFFAHKESILHNISSSEFERAPLIQPTRGTDAGICPKCGSKLRWRRAQNTDELYRGCINFQGGCRWNDRSY